MLRASALAKTLPSNRSVVQTVAGQPGETCVLLTDTAHDTKAPLLRRCTWGVVWPGSVSAKSGRHGLDHRGAAIGDVARVVGAAQDSGRLGLPMSCRPHRATRWAQTWATPSFAGWVPEGAPRALVVREARAEGKLVRRFEVTRLDTLTVDQQAGSPQLLVAFPTLAGWGAGSEER